MSERPTGTVNTKELFYCPTHGMIEPGRFESDWTTDEGCPVLMPDEESCGERMLPVDLSPVLRSDAPQHPQGCGGSGEVESWETEAACCGDTTSSGECRGHCAVPVQVSELDNCPGCSECRPGFLSDEERERLEVIAHWLENYASGLPSGLTRVKLNKLVAFLRSLANRKGQDR